MNNEEIVDGPQLVGEKVTVNGRSLFVERQLGEGGFSFVYLTREEYDKRSGGSPASKLSTNSSNNESTTAEQQAELMVLKLTCIISREQREIAEKEAILLSKLNHPSIVKIIDSCYRTPPPTTTSGKIVAQIGIGRMRESRENGNSGGAKHQHLILMEYCDGGNALGVMQHMSSLNQFFSLQSLIIAFGQICNAVSYMHAQKPAIVHRDLKPVNFLVHQGKYKLCDFGSVVFGDVYIDCSKKRVEAEEVILKTTTQMFRAPEMVDMYTAKKLTQSTDVWALGCCLYSMAFFQNCFEEGSNLAILSNNYKIPEYNPYGEDLVDLIDRMLTVDSTERADITEVILCLSALYAGNPLPVRKKVAKKDKGEEKGVGTFRTDGQGIRNSQLVTKKPAEAKKLNPNSAAARRRAGRNGKENKLTPTKNNVSKSVSKSDSSYINNTSVSSSAGKKHHTKQDKDLVISPSHQDDGDGFEACFAMNFPSEKEDSFFSDRSSPSKGGSFSVLDNPFSGPCADSGDSRNSASKFNFDNFKDSLPPKNASSDNHVKNSAKYSSTPSTGMNFPGFDDNITFQDKQSNSRVTPKHSNKMYQSSSHSNNNAHSRNRNLIPQSNKGKYPLHFSSPPNIYSNTIPTVGKSASTDEGIRISNLEMKSSNEEEHCVGEFFPKNSFELINPDDNSMLSRSQTL